MRRAIAIAPDLPTPIDIGAYANYLLWDGATDRARRLLESAPSLDSPEIGYMETAARLVRPETGVGTGAAG